MKLTKENRKWIDELQLSRPLTIAGPCSAETQQQVMDIAKSLQGGKIDFFRAGIWKPRTRPGMFEGVGALGLKWLQRVKQETGLKIATEVANADHVHLALNHDVDMLWIGARSTVSPFIVQEIAEALKGTDKIVLVKNPVNPDLSLWIGALERLHRAGIHQLGAIHRGFSTYEKVRYRNIPEWQIVIDLQNKIPELPIICDPSHITGNRDMIFDVSQMAMNLNFNGLMIETHSDPDNAWSDAPQQVTPTQLEEILSQLKVRIPSTSEQEYLKSLEKMRSHIDTIDEQILDMFKKRMHISEQIGALKRDRNISALQSGRWIDLLEKVVSEGKKRGLEEEFVSKVFKLIHQESIFHQGKILDQKI